ncbi:MAG: hypothetical protein J7L15_02620 [Clostridiales bacterium]|nr:hypothetical protein [Clostridiales bacterium]
MNHKNEVKYCSKHGLIQEHCQFCIIDKLKDKLEVVTAEKSKLINSCHILLVEKDKAEDQAIEIKDLKELISGGKAANREQAGKIDWLSRDRVDNIAAIKDLKEALIHYGSHKKGCKILLGAHNCSQYVCDCGFEEAQKKGKHNE